MAVTKIIDPIIIDSLISRCKFALLLTEKCGGDVIKLADTLFEDASDRFPDIQFYSIDADIHIALAERFGVKATPACLLFDGRGLYSEYTGAFSYDELNSLLTKFHLST